jgi:hypothetical protein
MELESGLINGGMGKFSVIAHIEERETGQGSSSFTAAVTTLTADPCPTKK